VFYLHIWWSLVFIKYLSVGLDMLQAERESVLSLFTAENAKQVGAVRLLIATDVASRGLDLPSLFFVLNYDAPRDLETYIHRAGRTGRQGQDLPEGLDKGIVQTLFTPADLRIGSKCVDGSFS
jgi:superfamily II DNA/RNA helicase